MSKQKSRWRGRANGRNGTGQMSSHLQDSTPGRRVASLPIYVGKTVVGYVEGDTFRKTVQSSKHFLRRPRAIAFDVSTLHDAEKAGARRVEVTDSDTGKVYQLPLSTIWAKGWEFNRGFGDQLGVPLDDWLRPGEREAVQPSLFGSAL